jgi:hypothetical protein
MLAFCFLPLIDATKTGSAIKRALKLRHTGLPWHFLYNKESSTRSALLEQKGPYSSLRHPIIDIRSRRSPPKSP